MIKGAVYNRSNGEIVKYITCPKMFLNEQIPNGCDFYENCPEGANRVLDSVAVFDPPTPPSDADLLRLLRQRRNSELAQSDWTQIPDTPLTVEKKTEWATYRQQLRDFPDVCDVNNPVWPTAPI